MRRQIYPQGITSVIELGADFSWSVRTSRSTSNGPAEARILSTRGH